MPTDIKNTSLQVAVGLKLLEALVKTLSFSKNNLLAIYSFCYCICHHLASRLDKDIHAIFEHCIRSNSPICLEFSSPNKPLF